MSSQIPEKDWKLLRQLKPHLLDRFCDRVLESVASIMTDSTVGSHERYLKIYEYTREQDRVLGSAFDDQRRSNVFVKLTIIYSLDLLTDEEFAQFTEETRRMIERSLKPA